MTVRAGVDVPTPPRDELLWPYTWDRIFGTYKYLPKDQLIYGVDTHMEPERHNRLGNLLNIPFKPIYRDNMRSEKKIGASKK